LILILLIGALSLNAQRPSKEELDLETLYIEATRSKLLGKEEEAITTFKKILEEDDTKDVVYFELAKIYLSKQLPTEALGAIRKAVALQPNNIWYQEELAAAYAANDDYVSAANVYKQLIDQRPGEQKFYYDLAFHYVKNNDIKEAIEVFNQHEKQFGVSEEVIGRKFNLYKTLDDSSKAENELAKLVKAFPNNVDYALGLAKFYEDTNNTGRAKATYQRILKIDADNIEAQVALNNLNDGKAQETSETMWADPEINIDIKISKIIPAINGLSKASEEKRQQIIDITQQITETHPTEAKAFAVHGDVLNFSNRTDEAILAYEGALRLEKNIYSVWDQLLYLYADQSKMQELLDKSEEAMDYFPNEATVYYLNGLAANSLGKHADALSSLMQADIMSRSNAELNALVQSEIVKAKSGIDKKNK